MISPIRQILLGSLLLSGTIGNPLSAAGAEPPGSIPSAPSLRSAIDVRTMGARGDGLTLDTDAFQKALDAAAESRGTVQVPPGRYLLGSVFLRSGITLDLSAGARLVGTTNLNAYRQPTPPSYMPEARWGKWHRALLIAENVDDVTVTGPGTIDGNRVFDPTGEEKMRGPHTLAMVGCRRFSVRHVNFVDAANYAVFFQVCDDVEFLGARFVGGWDGVHGRGAPERWCHRLRIVNCIFETGDDAIAGRYWEDTLITGCTVNSSCNGIRLIGPATHLNISRNLFHGPGAQPHRTSGAQRRTNMLSGIILQPGAWDETSGLLDDVVLADNTMSEVASPVTLWTKPGNPVGRVTIQGLHATGVYRSAFSAESWADAPITNVVLRQITAEFAGGGTAEQAALVVRGPGVDARPLPAWGLYARHVQNLVLEDVRLSSRSSDARPALQLERVDSVVLDQVHVTPGPANRESIVTKEVGNIVRR